MKLIMENWNRFLEEAYEIKSTGIVKLAPDELLKNVALKLQASIEDPEARPLESDRLHITLLHQKARPEGLSGGKWKKMLKNLPPYGGSIGLENKVVVLPFGDRKSWLIYVDKPTQAALDEYIINALRGVGLDDPTIMSLREKEAGFLGTRGASPTRKYHISLANLTGEPGDSVA
tara:strand:+ start:172 stop:696 length:525 start_codon:yes stop_codon:yes gene_type:complete